MNLFCRQLITRQQPRTGDRRLHAIFDQQLKWVSGSRISYAFLDDGKDDWKRAMRDAFAQWERHAELTFEEVTSRATIRIGFGNDGSWSYVGRDALSVSPRSRTMNIGWSPIDDPDVALHEIGHAIAMHHEHQAGGIDWHRENVIKSLSGPPNNWSVGQIENNVLEPIGAQRPVIKGSHDYDSIMHYPIPASWIKSGRYAESGIQPRAGLSVADKYWAAFVYPSVEPVEEESDQLSVQCVLSPGEQAAVKWKAHEDKEQIVETTGNKDSVLVVFKHGSSGRVQIAADDDSGEDRNARIQIDVTQGVEYEAVMRLYDQRDKGPVKLIVRDV